MQRLKPTAKPSKQRKLVFQAPDHSRRKLFSALLSPQLRASHGIKSFPVRNGDTVRIMRGDHKGFEGKISKVDRGECRVYVEGLTREKVDGTAIPVAVHPSKITITNLVLDDKWRKKILERKAQAHRATERVEAKPEVEAVEVEAKPEVEAVEVEAKPEVEAVEVEAKPEVEAAEVERVPRKELSKPAAAPKKRRAKRPAVRKKPARKPATEKQAERKTRKKSKPEVGQKTEAKTREKRRKTAEEPGGA